MKFHPYPKIGTSTESANGTWVATEKLYGVGFVVGMTADEMRFGSRERWLDRSDAFFGWQLMQNELGTRARKVWRWLQDSLPSSQPTYSSVYLYGEIIGGGYPHPDVPKVPGLVPVQTGVWYTPDLGWAMFDILAEGMFLSHRAVENAGKRANLATVPVLKRGTLAELELLPTGGPTLIPGAIELPPIDGNTREGIVLKPDRQMSPSTRSVFARKRPMGRNPTIAPLFVSQQLVSQEDLGMWAMRLTNQARIDSVRSKVGEDVDAILAAVVRSVGDDLRAAFPNSVFTANWSQLASAIEAEARGRLMNHILASIEDAIDGRKSETQS